MEENGGGGGEDGNKETDKTQASLLPGAELWKTNLEILSHKISIEDTKLRGPKGPLKGGGQSKGSQRLCHSGESKTA